MKWIKYFFSWLLRCKKSAPQLPNKADFIYKIVLPNEGVTIYSKTKFAVPFILPISLESIAEFKEIDAVLLNEFYIEVSPTWTALTANMQTYLVLMNVISSTK